MGRFIHARTTPEGLRFREWSTIVDAYTTPPVDRAAMVERLAESERRAYERAVAAIGVRLDRAAQHGTSDLDCGPHCDLDEPWETERCEGPGGCGGFHHVYKPRPSGACSECGEPEADRAHGAPCVVSP